MSELLKDAMRRTDTGDHVQDIEMAAYLEQSLPPEDRERLEVHMANCARCGEELAACANVEFEVATPLRPLPDTPTKPARIQRASALPGRSGRGSAWMRDGNQGSTAG